MLKPCAQNEKVSWKILNGRVVGLVLELGHFDLLQRIHSGLVAFNQAMQQFLNGEVPLCTGKLEGVKM